ncbi:MAG: glycosyltransferase, partial [Patescibacteria group bacterium]|nr:glycosyltransferase [Patescibacteria group bacterium]
DSDFLVGIVATNQARKDWNLGIRTCAELIRRGVNLKLWCHTDVLERYWSLPNLITDYGLQDKVVITNAKFTDEQMARFYSACNVCLSIGLGEGFGYPTYEALSCETPVVAGRYCGSEWLPEGNTVASIASRYEGIYCCKRPVYDALDWADAAQSVGITPFPEELDWNTLWPRWENWLKEGL